MLKEGNVNVSVTDIAGKKITDIINEKKPVGELKISVSAGKIGLSAGSYLVSVSFSNNEGNQLTQTKKITIMK
jgi:Fe-S cluster assembly iron-binding protein IscA